MHEGNAGSTTPAGEVRRDGEPHRGPFLQLLGALSMALGWLGLCFGLPAIPGLPLSLAVWVMARRDQEKMHVGLMDPDGKAAVGVARLWAVNGLILCIYSGFVWGVLLLYQALEP